MEVSACFRFHDVMPAEDWTRVVAAVEARMSELRMTRTALATSAGVNVKTIGNFLDAGMKPRTDSRGGYESALGWGFGSLLDIARGGQPTVLYNPAVLGPRDPGREASPPETSERPGLSVVKAIVEPMVDPEQDNEVLAAIRRDPDLDDASRDHFLNQYLLLRKLSRHERGDSLQHVAYDRRTGFDPHLEAEIEADVRRAGDENPDSPFRDK